MPYNYRNLRFISDYYTPEMVVIKIIRSEVQCGTITNISIPELPASMGVIQYKDLPAKKEMTIFKSEIPLLCNGKIMYEGEPILLLYGIDERMVEQAATEIQIEYETDYTIMPFENHSETQIDKKLSFTKGNPNKKLEKAHKRIEEVYFTSFQNNFDLEPQGAVAYKNKNKLEVICATQWPFNVRNNVAACLGMPEKEITISVPSMGKAHNGKLWYAGLLACFTSIVTIKTGKNSICIVPKHDAALYTPGRAASIIKHTTGLDKEGKIIARKINILLNSGAYPILSEEAINRMVFSAAGAYKSQSLKIKAKSIKTNSSPSGSFNGMGFHQSFFGGESHSNSLAKSAGLDPLEWRLQNIALNCSDLPICWENKKQLQIKELLLAVTEKSDFKRKHAAYSLSAKKQNYFSGKKRGIGLALCCQGNGFMGRVEENEKYSVSVRLEKDGIATIFTSAVPENFQTSTLWQEIAGNILEINPDEIKIESTITSLVPDSGPSLFSRNVTIITQLIEKCCNAIKKSRFRLPLPIEVKRNYKVPRSNGWDAETFSGTPFPFVSWGAMVIETETDPVTLESLIRGVWFAVDCGTILNKDLAKAEIENGIYSSISGSTASLKEQSYKRKKLPAAPSLTAEYFPISIDFLKSKEKKPGGLGDLPDSLVPPALSEALSMALNIKIKAIPSTPVLLYRKIVHKISTGEKKIED